MSLATNTEALQTLLESVKTLPEFALPKKTSITLSAASWSQSGEAYEQTVNVEGGRSNSLVALQPTVAQILTLQEEGVTALMVNNDNGTFKAYSVGEAPSTDMTIQATLTEVSV